MIPPDEYTASEQSPHLRSLYLYVIQHEDGSRVYYSGFDAPVTLVNIPESICPEGTMEFLPSQIRHGDVGNSERFMERSVNVSIDSNDTRIRRYFVVAAAVKLRCWIIRISTQEIGEEMDFNTDAFVVEMGILSKFAFNKLTITAELTPEPYYVGFSIPRHWYQRQCNHPLYGPGCTLNRNDFKFESTILSLDRAAREIVIAGRKSGGLETYFSAGMFYHPASKMNFVISWSKYEGTTDTKFKLAYWNPDLAVGQALTAYAGCRHTAEDCSTKFGNQANFGGFAWVPLKNPVTQGVA